MANNHRHSEGVGSEAHCFHACARPPQAVLGGKSSPSEADIKAILSAGESRVSRPADAPRTLGNRPASVARCREAAQVCGHEQAVRADPCGRVSRAVGAEADSANIQKLIGELKGKDVAEVIKAGTEKLAKVSAAAPAAAAPAAAAGGAAPAAGKEAAKKKARACLRL